MIGHLAMSLAIAAYCPHWVIDIAPDSTSRVSSWASCAMNRSPICLAGISIDAKNTPRLPVRATAVAFAA